MSDSKKNPKKVHLNEEDIVTLIRNNNKILILLFLWENFNRNKCYIHINLDLKNTIYL